ncbi:hypothetical protein [Paraburkholderia saeva]|uniref:hypothetical protein n=1 Tax=Paraburkholderia saeva TaxID=2777537 RepID=UPI001D605947|nr:hypothetical protein [Paraburkholderia saeva]CAG4908360.1 hypothetical protein R52603_03620 [Paraburkholderia saeva]
MNNPEAVFIASCAADYLERLEAMFDAIREHLKENTYPYSLADLGQGIASQYSADMRRLADAEENRT